MFFGDSTDIAYAVSVRTAGLIPHKAINIFFTAPLPGYLKVIEKQL
jgi:hypothetical protein